MERFREMPRYIIRRGAALSAVMLAAVVLLLVWASARPAQAWLLHQYAASLQSMSAVVLGAGLLGGLALEDVLRRF